MEILRPGEILSKSFKLIINGRTLHGMSNKNDAYTFVNPKPQNSCRRIVRERENRDAGGTVEAGSYSTRECN